MPDSTPTLTDELAAVLDRHRLNTLGACGCGGWQLDTTGPLIPALAGHRMHVADTLASLIARMVADAAPQRFAATWNEAWRLGQAEAGCELQRTGDGTHGPLIRQAKAEALREFARKWADWTAQGSPQTRGGAAYRAICEAQALESADHIGGAP